MKKFTFIVGVVALVGSSVWAKYDPIWSLPEVPQGWSPAQAADYQGAQIAYAQQARRYGERSEQAQQAKQRMIELARALKVTEREVVPPRPEPGTNGTFAPAEAFDNQPDPIQVQ